VRAGLFGWEPPTRFSVAPSGASRLLASQAPEEAEVCRELMQAGFRAPKGPQRDLRAFFDLSEAALQSDELEGEVVEWARVQFGKLVDAGFFALHGAATDEEPPPDVSPV
jgi:hypothetical protein